MIEYEISVVRSGGQNGADLAGVCAAKVCGIKTGGWMPKGWKTLDGPRPAYAEFFGMEEFPAAKGYPARTRANVADSDATIRFASDFGSPGEVCTLRAIKERDKPHLDVRTDRGSTVGASSNIAAWVMQGGYRRLNIAGNSRRTSPVIESFVYSTMLHVFFHFGYHVVDHDLDRYCKGRFDYFRRVD